MPANVASAALSIGFAQAHCFRQNPRKNTEIAAIHGRILETGAIDPPSSPSPGFNCQTARGYASAFSRLKCARALRRFPPSTEKPRAQGKPGARCTRDLVCNCVQRTRTRAYRSSGGIPAFPARWVTAYFELSPVNGFLATVAPRDTPAKLNASTAAPGPHDFAVR
jgi:hypothetical protein